LAQQIVAAQDPSLRKVPEQMPVRANAEEPLAHFLEGGHLLDAVRVEVLELLPVVDVKSAPYVKHTASRTS
jgi:hypothetical protein